MPSKRATTVCVEYVNVFCTHLPSLFPILTFDIMLTTRSIVDTFKLYYNDDNVNKLLQFL